MEFGRLYPIHRYRAKEIGKTQHCLYYYCICSCGNTSLIRSTVLKSGKTKSCGCLTKDVASSKSGNNSPNFKHGHSSKKRTKTYRTWGSMIERCNNPKQKAYKYYGGRGIAISERWLGEKGFKNFLQDMGEKPPGLMIDRIDNNGNYEPSNCRWVTRVQQNQNKRKWRMLII